MALDHLTNDVLIDVEVRVSEDDSGTDEIAPRNLRMSRLRLVPRGSE